jgi:hypothetical protein
LIINASHQQPSRWPKSWPGLRTRAKRSRIIGTVATLGLERAVLSERLAG